ncbi:hypothetical protein BDF21DRAFT_388654 [Thamnidium elegans]|nr:hypothetical protein BDF21DRAFT_388654 [Thamnidium elegans]
MKERGLPYHRICPVNLSKKLIFDDRVRLLQLMANRLQERPLVDKIFDSVNSSSNDPLIERDSQSK